jgi:hypothetical protein
MIVIGEHLSDSSAGSTTPVNNGIVLIKVSRAGAPDEEGIPIAIIELREGIKVGDALTQMLTRPLPHPISFSKSKISILRSTPGEEKRVLFVAWAPGAKAPTAETNHELQAGDQIIIREPALSIPTMGEVATPATAPEANVANLGRAESRDLITYHAQIVEDSSGSMAEFVTSANKIGAEIVLGDTRTIDSAMRILSKNELVRVVSKPQVMTRHGEEAELKIEGSPRDKIELALLGYRNGNSIQTKVTFAMTKDGRDSSAQFTFSATTGQTAIIEFNPRFSDSPVGPTSKPIYIVITPKTKQP